MTAMTASRPILTGGLKAFPGYHKGALDGLAGGGILHLGYVPAHGKLGGGLAPAEKADLSAVQPSPSKASHAIAPEVALAISKQVYVRQQLKPRMPPPPLQTPKQPHGTFTIQQLREERARRNGWSAHALKKASAAPVA